MNGWTPAALLAAPCSKFSTQASDRESRCPPRPFSRLVKLAALSADFQGGEAESISGHSLSVGAGQDKMSAGLDHLAIMQAGGCKTFDVVARYVEKAAARVLHERRWTRLAR